MSEGVSAHVSRYPLCMNKTNDNKKNSQSLKPISPFLQRVQETHEELMAGKGVRLVTDDTMERSNAIRITEPYSIFTLFHTPPHSLIDQIQSNYKQAGFEIVDAFQISCHRDRFGFIRDATPIGFIRIG